MTTVAPIAWQGLPRGAGSVPRRRTTAAFVLCGLALALSARLVYLARVFDADGAMFIYMGKLTSEGGRLCHDLIDNKFPTVGLMTSVPWRLFGANWSSYVLLGAALSLAAALLLGRIAQRHIGRHAVLPVALFAMVYLNFHPAVFGGFQLETMQVFFTVLSAGAAIEALRGDDPRDAFVAGLAAGCAAMLKPTGLAVVAAFVIALAVSRRGKGRHLLRPLGMLSLGLLIPASAVVGYVIAADILRDMPQLIRQIGTYAGASAWTWHDLLKPPTVGVILGLPFIVRGWICRRAAHRLDAPVDRSLAWFLVAWFVLELVGIVCQRRMYAYHFLVLAPPAALLFGTIPRLCELKPLAAGLTPVLLLSVYSAWTTMDLKSGHARLPASDYLLAHAERGDAVWQDELMRLLLETNLRPGSRVPMSFLFANHDEAPLEYSAMMIDDFQRTRPRYILLPAELDRWVAHQASNIAELKRVPRRRENFVAAWGRIRVYVEQHYAIETTIGRETIWRRRCD